MMCRSPHRRPPPNPWPFKNCWPFPPIFDLKMSYREKWERSPSFSNIVLPIIRLEFDFLTKVFRRRTTVWRHCHRRSTVFPFGRSWRCRQVCPWSGRDEDEGGQKGQARPRGNPSSAQTFNVTSRASPRSFRSFIASSLLTPWIWLVRSTTKVSFNQIKEEEETSSNSVCLFVRSP